MKLQGTVASGLGHGAQFLALDWVLRELRDKLGLTPFPGTLNLRVSAEARSALFARRERLMQMVRLCPSGALEIQPEADGEQLEPALPVRVDVVRDGPLWVRGRVPVTSADGETYEVRNRMTLCRCGHSETKPFCDGSHKHVGFTDG